MTEQLKPCPFCGGEAEFESPVQGVVVRCKSCGIALAKELNPSLYTGYDALKRAEKRWVIDRWNTRPSASREIAVKPLKWYENGTRSIAHTPDGHYWILDCHDGQWGLIERGKNGFTVGHGNACLFTGPEDARLGADILNRKRILANLCADTAPGNTDPIAKYDDELRKVQGGWREDVDTDFICPPIPDRSHDWYARFKWHDGDTDLRGHGKTELDAVFDLFRNALDFDDGDGSEQETILDAAWLGIGGVSPTEHPTEQPVYETCSKCSGSGQMIGDAGEPTLCSECKGDTVVASEQPSVRDAAHSLVALNQDGEISAMMDITNMKLTDVLCTLDGWHPDFVTLTIMPRAAALRSLAQEGE